MAGRAGRTYKRDGNGRFASTGTSVKKSRPPAKSVAKGVNKLTRDNAGKITSVGGDGATARGGRLKTAAGNLRATQTKRLKTMQGVSYGKPAAKTAAKGSKAAASTLRPGEFVKANLRPRNVAAKPQVSDKSWGKTKKENLAKAEALARSEGYKPYVDTRRKAKGIASFSPIRPDKITLVKNSEYWSNPKKYSIEGRRSGWFASSNPKAVVMHEIGHSKTKRSGFINDASKAWGIGVRPFDSQRNKRLARRVSEYASTSPSEFAAETYAGRRTGRKYDYEVMQAYRQEKGLNPNPIVRRLKKKPKK